MEEKKAPEAPQTATKKKYADMTLEEKKAHILDQKNAAIKAAEDKMRKLEEEALFGGFAAINRQKWLLGEAIWRAAQDPKRGDVRQALMGLYASMDKGQKEEMDTYLKAVGLKQ